MVASFICGVWQYALDEARLYAKDRNQRMMDEQRARIREVVAMRKLDEQEQRKPELDFARSNDVIIAPLPLLFRHSTDTSPRDIRYKTIDEHGQVHDPTNYAESVRKWFSDKFPIPDWAYVATRGETERLLDEEIEQLELELAEKKASLTKL